MKTSRSTHQACDWLGTLVVVFAIAGAVPNAWGQTAADWHRSTTLAGFVGAASASPETRVAAGAAVGWELTPHFTLEGRGTWLDAGSGADAFTARIPLLPARQVVPVLSGGVGVYRATFSASTGIPPFYRRRMTPDARGRTFHDFVTALGGGVDISLARHLALRPAVTVLLVTTRSDIRAVPVYGVELAYHFEDRPITPVGRARGARGAR
jgi:hypothetical protein